MRLNEIHFVSLAVKNEIKIIFYDNVVKWYGNNVYLQLVARLIELLF